MTNRNTALENQAGLLLLAEFSFYGEAFSRREDEFLLCLRARLLVFDRLSIKPDKAAYALPSCQVRSTLRTRCWSEPRGGTIILPCLRARTWKSRSSRTYQRVPVTFPASAVPMLICPSRALLAFSHLRTPRLSIRGSRFESPN